MKLVPPGGDIPWWEAHPEHGFDWNAYREIEERLIKSGKLKELDILHRVVDEDELMRAKDARFLKQNPFSTPAAPGSDSEFQQNAMDQIFRDPEFNKWAREARKEYLTKEPLKIAKPWYREAAVTRNDDWPTLPREEQARMARHIVERARGGPHQIWPDQFEKTFGLRPGEIYFEGAPMIPRKLGPNWDTEFTEGYRSDNPRNILKDPRFAPSRPNPWRWAGLARGAGLGVLMGLFDKQTEMARMGEDSWDPRFAEPGVNITPEVFQAVGNAYGRIRGRR